MQCNSESHFMSSSASGKAREIDILGIFCETAANLVEFCSLANFTFFRFSVAPCLQILKIHLLSTPP